jgi:predicted dienelactone hydrolase
MMKKLFLFAVLFVSCAQAAETIGVRTFHYQDEKRGRPVSMEVWYPIDQDGAPGPVEEDVWIHPKESRDAPISNALSQYPVVILSHGNQGDRRERSWLAEMLVKSKFVVASVDHFGNTRQTFNPMLSMKFWERPRDVSFALDRLFEESFFQGRIDSKRVGFSGYSLGGMTGLALAGGVVDQVEHVVQAIKARLKDVPAALIDRIDFSEATARLGDPRIKAYFLIAPANFLYSAKALQKIKAPIGLVLSVDDEVLPHKEHSYFILQNLIPKKLKVFRKGLSHFAFLNPTSEMGKNWLPAKICNDPLGCKRSQIHKEVGSMASQFFLETLSDRPN